MRYKHYVIPVAAYVLSIFVTLLLYLPFPNVYIFSLDNSEIILNDVYPFTTTELSTVHSLGLDNTALLDVYHVGAWGYTGFSKEDKSLYQEAFKVTMGSAKGSDVLWWIYLGESPSISISEDSKVTPSEFTEVFEFFSAEFAQAISDVYLYGLLSLVLLSTVSISLTVLYGTKFGKKNRNKLNASLITRMFILMSAMHLLLVYILLIHRGPGATNCVGLDLEARTGIKYTPSDSFRRLTYLLFVLFLVQVVWGVHHDRVRLADIDSKYKLGAQTTPNGMLLLPYGYKENGSKSDMEKSD